MRTDQKLCCLKTALIVALCILWLVGSAIFGIVLWLRLDFWTTEYMRINSELEKYLILIYIALAAGAIIALFSLLGLIGACLKNKIVLILYLAAVVLAMLVTVSAVVYGIIYRDELRNTLVTGNLLENIIKNNYMNLKTDPIVRAVNIMQSELECCGAISPMDYSQSNWRESMKSDPNYQEKYDSLVPVPPTCCKDYLRYQDSNAQNCYVYKPETQQVKSDDIWQTGCQVALQEFLDRYVVVVISIAVVFFVLQVVAIIICIALIRLLSRLYVPQPDEIVYDMAQNQEKSPYPSRGDYRDYYH